MWAKLVVTLCEARTHFSSQILIWGPASNASVSLCKFSVVQQAVNSHAMLQAKRNYPGDNALGDAEGVSTQRIASN